MDDKLLAPLKDFDDITSDDLTSEKFDTKIPIPIPNPSYLMKESLSSDIKQFKTGSKYEKEYDEFCRWSALPKDLRKPKTGVEFEKKHMIPSGYTDFFRRRDDFQDRRLTYFWEWMMDLYPDVVYSIYQRATNKKGSDKAAGIFIELLSKKMNLDKPRLQVQPMVLMGVPQEKIDALFTPKGYDSEKLIPGKLTKK